MALKNPLGMIKDVAVTSLKAPVTVAGSAVGLARATTGKAAGVVTSLVTAGSGTEMPKSEWITDEIEVPDVTVTPTEPVNVIDELGLDPAPVEKPKPARKPAKKPVTKIDAAVDSSDVDATPADIAKIVSKD